ncbi:unnamed protein product, partial [marine sediment metagenome]
VVEPLITSVNGFVRYRIGDLYLVKNLDNRYVLEFKHRSISQVSLGIERISEEDIYQVVNRTIRSLGLKVSDYICLSEDRGSLAGRYWFLLSTPEYNNKLLVIEKAETLIDKIFQEINIEFKNSRTENRFLLQPKVVLGHHAKEIINKVIIKYIKN